MLETNGKKCMGDYWLGKKHKEETKKKIGLASSKHQRGSGNSNYGKIWITNGKETKRFDKAKPIPRGWSKGRSDCKHLNDNIWITNGTKCKWIHKQDTIPCGWYKGFNKIWITDGIQNKMVVRTEPIPDGWRRGRIYNRSAK